MKSKEWTCKLFFAFRFTSRSARRYWTRRNDK